MQLDDQALADVLAPVSTVWETLPGLRGAAVLAGLLRRDGQDCLVFTERRSDLPTHPGQISFPGGSREGEEEPATCALRETHEEILVPAASITLLGALPNRTSTSTFRVHPVVGRIHHSARLEPDPSEVESVFAVPFAELLEERRWEERIHALARLRGSTRTSPHFQHDSHLIWGLTGRLTRDLLALIARTSDPG